MSKVIHIKSREHYNELKRKHAKLVILYGAEWCKACDDIVPLYTRIANRYPTKVTMAYADAGILGLEFTNLPVGEFLYQGKVINNFLGADCDALKFMTKQLIKKN